jgi:hypothetical protein
MGQLVAGIHSPGWVDSRLQLTQLLIYGNDYKRVGWIPVYN